MRFWRENQAAVTVEFVVIFPLLLAVLFLIIFVSMYYSIASDVQQMAHDLARFSMRYIGREGGVDLCTVLRAEAVQVFLDATLLLKPEKFTLVSCDLPQSANGFVTLTVAYDFAGSSVQAFGKTFGIEIGTITRSSHFMP